MDIPDVLMTEVGCCPLVQGVQPLEVDVPNINHFVQKTGQNNRMTMTTITTIIMIFLTVNPHLVSFACDFSYRAKISSAKLSPSHQRPLSGSWYAY